MSVGTLALQGDGCALHRLDARGNAVAELQELAPLAACPHLQELLLYSAPLGECSLLQPLADVSSETLAAARDMLLAKELKHYVF